jgi:hypothetical protein
MNNAQPIPKPVRKFAINLVEAGGYFSVVIAQMADYSQRHPNPDAKPIPYVLRDLVQGILADELKAHPEDVATAARIVDEAIDAISQNLFFVDESLIEDAEAGGPELD